MYRKVLNDEDKKRHNKIKQLKCIYEEKCIVNVNVVQLKEKQGRNKNNNEKIVQIKLTGMFYFVFTVNLIYFTKKNNY